MNAHTVTLANVLTIQKLSKKFGERFAVSQASWSAQSGQIICLLGHSGCGKTTMLRLIAGLETPTEGSIQLERKVLWDQYQQVQAEERNIGFVFQSFNLIDELNIYENVELPLSYLKIKSSDRKEKVDEILKRMNISHRANHFPQQLSGGQQQRVAIARAVVASPKLILADEPTGNLDSKNGAEAMALLTELNKEGTTIIMVTHSKHDSLFAHRTINLFDGGIVNNLEL